MDAHELNTWLILGTLFLLSKLVLFKLNTKNPGPKPWI